MHSIHKIVYNDILLYSIYQIIYYWEPPCLISETVTPMAKAE